MRRREFIRLLSSTVVAWPLTARAQQAAMPVIGLLGSETASDWRPYISAFHQGLRDTGYEEGRNVAIEARWADSQYDRLPAMAAELVASSECDCCFLYTCGACGEGDDDNNPCCLHNEPRSRADRSRRQPKPPGWQCDRRDQLGRRGRLQAPGATA